ncbi:MAG: hypothetical protein Q9223_004221 [Gallowayella weberi]
MPSPVSKDLYYRVYSWAQEVNKHADHTKAPALLTNRPGRVISNGMRLRDRPARKTLADISINPHCRKRKVGIDIPDKVDSNTEPAKKRKGRPPGSKNKIPAGNADESSSYNEERTFSPPSASSAKTPSPRKSSPTKSKRGDKTLDQPRSDATIDMPFLGTCDPAVIRTGFGKLKAAGKVIPEASLKLRQKLLYIPKALVPGELKAQYDKDIDTPRKSKDPLPDSEYQDLDETPFTKYELERLKHMVGEVLRKASTAAEIRAHERQWGSIMTQILQEAEGWPVERNVVLFNVETCSIQPVDFKPVRPDTRRPLDNSAPTTSADTTKGDAPDNLGRMVDWVLALALSDQDGDLVRRAFSRCLDNEHSLNQTLSYITHYPIFTDIEVKTSSNRDPEVQLSIWAAAAVSKRRHHGWNTGIPMPGIVVDGHMWKWYLFFVVGADVMMTGPEYFGDTSTTQGIWTILYRLHILIEWGTTVFAQWVHDEIIAWANGKLSCQDDV